MGMRDEPGLPVTLVVGDCYANFSISGIPFFVSGETAHWTMLAHRQRRRARGGRAATVARPQRRGGRPLGSARQGGVGHRGTELAYDELVIGTGAVPIVPPLPGVDLPGVHVLHTIDEARRLRGVVDSGARRITLIGAGYIGTEMADALTHSGVEVTIVEMAPAVLSTFDADLGTLVGAELERHGVGRRRPPPWRHCRSRKSGASTRG
jgi:NADPH-dependent 2,4-dienoyl-CoA reductase/sulfur reductase-like enzyme